MFGVHRRWSASLVLGVLAAAVVVPAGVASARPGRTGSPDRAEREGMLSQVVENPAAGPVTDRADPAAGGDDDAQLVEAQSVENPEDANRIEPAKAGGGEQANGAGDEPAITVLKCSTGQSGVWGKLGNDRHDNLLVTTDARELVPGQPFTMQLQWEWRDWRPGAPLVLRACFDVDDVVDGKAGTPVDDLGAGPVDVTFVHPETEPAAQIPHRSGKMRPIVTAPFTVTVPASTPPGGELCIRTAVTGLPTDHRTSPPLFDVSESLCRPIAQVPAAPPPPPVAQAPPAEIGSEVLGEQVTGTAALEIPSTGSWIGMQTIAGVLLILSGLGMAGTGRRRLEGDGGATRRRPVTVL